MVIYCSHKKEVNINTIEFLEIEDIQNDILITKDKLIRILKIFPINYDLKSEFEKQSIINSYKTVLKTCNFDFQILILSEKENINSNIEELNNILFSKIDLLDRKKIFKSDIEEALNIEKEKEKLSNIYFEYISYIEKLNYDENITSKAFYIIIFEEKLNKKEEKANLLNILKTNKKTKEKSEVDNLKWDSKVNDYSKKEEFTILTKNLIDKEKRLVTSLSRCGNRVSVLKTEEIYNLFDLSRKREYVKS